MLIAIVRFVPQAQDQEEVEGLAMAGASGWDVEMGCESEVKVVRRRRVVRSSLILLVVEVHRSLATRMMEREKQKGSWTVVWDRPKPQDWRYGRKGTRL